MYIIDSANEMPDHDYLMDRIKGIIDQGLAITNVQNLYSKLLEAQNASARNLKSLYGIDNPNSSAQVLHYLESVLTDDIVSACVDDTGKWSSNKQAMTTLAMQGYQDAIDILSYRKAKKYTESANDILTYLNGDGKIRPKVTIGKTNRLNFKNPALMNIPKKLIWHIIAPRTEGNILMSVDIKNQEPWIMINMLDITVLKELLDVKGGLYESVFHKIFDRDCVSIERDELKIAWNAMTYGATIYGIKQICKHTDGESIFKFFNTIPQFKKYKNDCYKQMKKNQQTTETYFGTVLEADEFGPRLKRVLMDLPIQGTGADILALLVKHFDSEIESRGLEDYISLYFSRHDELIIEVDRKFFEEHGENNVAAILADILEHRVDDWEPFQVKIGQIIPGEDFFKVTSYAEDEEE